MIRTDSIQIVYEYLCQVVKFPTRNYPPPNSDRTTLDRGTQSQHKKPPSVSGGKDKTSTTEGIQPKCYSPFRFQKRCYTYSLGDQSLWASQGLFWPSNGRFSVRETSVKELNRLSTLSLSRGGRYVEGSHRGLLPKLMIAYFPSRGRGGGGSGISPLPRGGLLA